MGVHSKIMVMTMAKSKVKEALLKAVEENPPKTPALSAADKTYLRGLKRRGYTEGEITVIVQKAGLLVPPDLFEQKKKKRTTTPHTTN